MKILFMGTSEFAIPTLEMLINSGWPLLGVVTRPDRPRGRGRKLAAPPVKQYLSVGKVPVYQPASSGELAEKLMSGGIRPDVIVVVAYGMLLPAGILDTPLRGCVNLHPSLLPAYRGAAPIQRAIINGEARSGITTMYLSEEMDAGDIILQEELEVDPETTYGEFERLAAEKGAALMFETLTLIEQGRAPRLPQEHNRATYAPPIRAEEEKIDWSRSAKSIHDLIRGMNPRPGAYTLFKEKNLKIWRGRLEDAPHTSFRPGQVVTADPKRGFTVQTGTGQLLITEVQPAGRPPMSGAEFVRGYRIFQGLTLGE